MYLDTNKVKNDMKQLDTEKDMAKYIPLDANVINMHEDILRHKKRCLKV